jgi:hypothetical protein
MNQASDRIPCPKCQASNFPNSAVCWQCGEPMSGARAQVSNETPGGPTPPPPAPGYAPPQPIIPHRQDDGQNLVVIGFVLAALGFLCCPLIFGAAAIVLGILAMNKGNKLGVWVIVAGAGSLVLGTILGVIMKKALLEYLKANPQLFPKPPLPTK